MSRGSIVTLSARVLCKVIIMTDGSSALLRTKDLANILNIMMMRAIMMTMTMIMMSFGDENEHLSN